MKELDIGEIMKESEIIGRSPRECVCFLDDGTQMWINENEEAMVLTLIKFKDKKSYILPEFFEGAKSRRIDELKRELDRLEN